MYADVILQVQKHSDALVVPIQAVSRADTKSSVLIVSDENRVVARDIRTGLEDPNSIEVVSGLKEGDRVIVANLGSYQNGEVVNPRLSAFTGASADGGKE